MCHKGVCQRERLRSPGESCLGSVGFGLEVLPAEIGQFLGRVGRAQGHRRGGTAAPLTGWLPLALQVFAQPQGSVLVEP